MKKRIIAMVLAMVSLFTIAPAPVFAVGVEHSSEVSAEAMPVTDQTAVNEEQTRHPMIGKIVTLVEQPGMLVAIEDPTVSTSGSIVGVKAYPERMEIEAVVTVGDVTYYQLKAAEGSWPDYFGTVYEHYWLPATQVEEIQPACPDCGEKDCPGHTEQENPNTPSISATVTDASGKTQTVTVSGDALPDGATLEVKPIANEAAIMEELLMERGYLWDIKVYDADGNEWQPAEGQSVKLKLPIVGIPERSTVNLMHALDTVDAIKAGIAAGTVEYDDVSHLSEVFRQSFSKEIAVCQAVIGRTNSVALEYFSEMTVYEGYVVIKTESFSVYTWDGGFKTSTAGSSSSERIVFNANNSHNGSNGMVFYVDSHVSSNQSVYLDCGGKRTYRKWSISRDGVNWQQNNNNTCVVESSGDPYDRKSVIYNDVELKVGTHEIVYSYGSVFWVRCTMIDAWFSEKESAVVKFVVVSDRDLTYNANGVSCTLPSASSWKSTYWGSPTSDKVGSDAHVAPSTIKIGKPTNIQGNYHFLYWENTDSHNANAIYYPSDSYSPSLVAGSLHLRAKWARYYKVTLDAQNGSGDSDGTTAYWYLYNTTKVVNNETVYYWKNQDCTTPLSNYTIEKPTKVGYTFNGYWTGKNGTGTQYVDKNGVCINNLYSARQEDITLYADWDPIPNAVVYTYTGTVPVNAPDAPAQKNYDYNSSVTVEAAPTLTGYTFSGWTTSDATVSGGEFTMPNKLVSFTGSWTANKYDLYFDYNGGKNSESNSTAVSGPFPAETGSTNYYEVKWLNPARDGYVFAGWYDAPSGGTKVYYGANDKDANGNSKSGYCIPNGSAYWDENSRWKDTEGKTFYAHWIPNSHNVTYSYTGTVPAGAEPVPVVGVKVNYGTEVTVAANPTAIEGYTFTGWTVSGASVTNGKFIMPDNDVTIIGSWTVSLHTVIFKDDSGNVLSSNVYPYGTEAEAIVVPNAEKAPTAEYTYTFTGWDLEISDVTGDTTYTASYDKTPNPYTITWVFGNGAESVVETLTYGNAIVKPADPTRTGYDFKDWSPAVPDTMPAEDQTFTAQWEGKRYTLYVYATYGQPGKNSAYTVQYGKDLNNDLSSVITVPTGIRLKGLFTAQNSGGTQVYDGNAKYLAGTYWDELGHWQYEGNLTVYADWERIEYAITYVDTLAQTSTTETYDAWDTSHVLKNAENREGYNFKGWIVKETTGTWPVGTTYEAGTQTWGFSGDVTLETVWEVAYVDLTIRTSCNDKEQSFVFDIVGPNGLELTVILVGDDQQKIVDLPVGSYTVAERTDWSWRQADVAAKTVELKQAGQTVDFSFGAAEDDRWLSGWAHGFLRIVKEVGNG